MSGRSFRISIRARLVLANALLLAAAAAAPLLVLPKRLEAHARSELELRALDIAWAFGAASEVALDFADRQRATETLRGLASARGATYGALLRADGSALATWGRVPPPSATGPGADAWTRYEADGLHVQVPVLTPSGERGALRIGIDLEDLRRRRESSWGLVGSTAAAVFLVGLVALFLLATFLTKPVRALTALAERIARGDEGAARQLATERRDEAGTVAVALGAVMERLTAQRAMLQSQSEATNEGILTLDVAGAVITHNRRLRDLWSLERQDVDGSTWRALRPLLEGAVAGPLPGWLSVAAPVLPDGHPESFDLALKDGRTLTTHAATVRKPDGEPLGLGLYFRDITRRVQDQRRISELAESLERRVEQRTRELAATTDELGRRLEELRRTQEQLVIADRRISVGRLAAGVAHEINNPLSYLLGNLRFVSADLANLRSALRTTDETVRRASETKLDEMLEALGDAAGGAERVARIVQGLKAFSRGDEDRREPVDLARAMDVALQMADHEIRHRARLVREAGEAPAVMANEVRLSQVLLNLLINAAQATPAGAADQHTITATIGTDAAGWAYAEVRDTGCGIPPEVRGRIFDPFFTTKSQGQGTGLGLSISQGIVTSFGGSIEVSSEPGRGSTFRVRLPPARAGEERPERADTPLPALGGTRVLVVDDEPMVALAMQRLLARERNEVSVAHSGSDALDRLRAGERFDLVLCDLMMPGMTGMRLYEELTRIAPEQARAVVFMSGGTFTEATEAFVERHRERFVQKPFDLEDLRRVVHATLRN